MLASTPRRGPGSAAVDDEDGEYCVAGTALITGLLKGLLDLGVTLHTEARALELIADDGAIVGVRITHGGKDIRVRARAGVVLGTGGFEWDEALVEAFLRGPMRGPVSPPNNTGDGLRMAMALGAELANMGEAWWVPIIQIPVTRSRASHAAEACGSNAPGREASSSTVQAGDSSTRQANTTRWRARSTTSTRATATSTIRPGSSSTTNTSSDTGSSVLSPTAQCRRGSASRGILSSWPRRRESTRRSGADAGRVERARRRRTRSRVRPRLQRLRRILGRQRRRHNRWKDPRPDRHLRGPGDGGRDGNQGRSAHGSRRPRSARQRRADTGAVRRGQRDGRCDREGLRRCRRNHRPGNGFRFPGRICGGDGEVCLLAHAQTYDEHLQAHYALSS